MVTSAASAATTPILLSALFRAADDASTRAQTLHLGLLRGDLAGLVAGAILTSVNAQGSVATALNVLGAVTLSASLVLTVLLVARRGEQRWYGARFIAESVKTLSWQYMMAARSYPASLPEQEADQRFIASLQELLTHSGALDVDIGGSAAIEGQITEQMRAARALPLEERRTLYRTHRINDQRAWYARRSHSNQKAGSKLLILVITVQLGAVLFAVLSVAVPGMSVNGASILSAAAAACLAWLEARRHQELAQSYGVAAHELGFIAEHEHHVVGESQFADFVANAEAAISKEHILWVARRDVPTVRVYSS